MTKITKVARIIATKDIFTRKEILKECDVTPSTVSSCIGLLLAEQSLSMISRGVYKVVNREKMLKRPSDGREFNNKRAKEIDKDFLDLMDSLELPVKRIEFLGWK